MSQVAGVFTAAADARHLRRGARALRRLAALADVAVDLGDRPGRLRLLYYWHHRAGHRVALFWAAHVVHHQSEDYNLSTALRQTSSGWLVGWIFYLPMAIAGFPPLVFARRRADRPALPVLGPHRAGRPPRLVRPLVLRAVQPPRPPRRQRRATSTATTAASSWSGIASSAPTSRRIRRAVRLRHAGAAQELEPDPRQPAGLRRARPRFAGARRAGLDKLRVWLKPPGWRPADVAARWPKAPFVVDALRAIRSGRVAAPSGARAVPVRCLARRDDVLPLARAHPGLAGASGVRAGDRRRPLYGVGRLSEDASAPSAPEGSFRAGGLSSQAPPEASP